MKMVMLFDNSSLQMQHSSDDYCCDKMKKVMESKKYSMFFDPIVAETFCERRDGGIYWYWEYCPFCGKNIKSKHKMYEKVLRQEFGIVDPYDEKISQKLPEEFKTDAWWKKRGL